MTNPRRQPQRPHPHRHLNPTPLPEPTQPRQHRPHHLNTHLHPTGKRIIAAGRRHRRKPPPDKPILPSAQPPLARPRPRPTHPRKPRSIPARTRSALRGGGARETVLACVRADSTRTLQVRFTDEPLGDRPVPAQRHRPIPTPIPRPGVKPAQPRPPARRHLADHVVERPAALDRAGQHRLPGLTAADVAARRIPAGTGQQRQPGRQRPANPARPVGRVGGRRRGRVSRGQPVHQPRPHPRPVTAQEHPPGRPELGDQPLRTTQPMRRPRRTDAPGLAVAHRRPVQRREQGFGGGHHPRHLVKTGRFSQRHMHMQTAARTLVERIRRADPVQQSGQPFGVGSHPRRPALAHIQVEHHIRGPARRVEGRHRRRGRRPTRRQHPGPRITPAAVGAQPHHRPGRHQRREHPPRRLIQPVHAGRHGAARRRPAGQQRLAAPAPPRTSPGPLGRHRRRVAGHAAPPTSPDADRTPTGSCMPPTGSSRPRRRLQPAGVGTNARRDTPHEGVTDRATCSRVIVACYESRSQKLGPEKPSVGAALAFPGSVTSS